MFERRENIRKWFYEVIEKFRQKGAISPDKAMTAEELGLPPRFEDAMKRRLGRLGVFVEVSGKYYLSEERLKQIEELRRRGGAAWNSRKKMLALRTFQMIAVILFLTLLLANFLFPSWELRVLAYVFLVAWLLISVLQLYYLLRIRNRGRYDVPNRFYPVVFWGVEMAFMNSVTRAAVFFKSSTCAMARAFSD
jgi:hypothetical protein